MARSKRTPKRCSGGKYPTSHLVSQSSKGSQSSAATGGLAKKRHRYRSGTVALREIRKYQKSTELLIKRQPFQRLVKEIATQYRADLRFQSTAIEALQVNNGFIHILKKTTFSSYYGGPQLTGPIIIRPLSIIKRFGLTFVH